MNNAIGIQKKNLYIKNYIESLLSSWGTLW